MAYTTVLNSVLILGAAIVVIVISKRLRIAPVIGFILTGLIWAAFSPSSITATDGIKILSEFGVVFLLFMVGLDFTPEKVRRLSRTMFIGGSVQAAITLGLACIVALLGFISFTKAILGAFIVIQSSTAIALKVYQDRGEINSPHAETSIGISLFQDISTVFLLILIPILGAGMESSNASVFLSAGWNLLLLVLFSVAAYFVLPLILRVIVATGIRELVILLALVLCLGCASVSQALGFSMALGAFICGILLNRSEYHSQIIADTAPFRDVFLSLFFISIGIGYDWKFALGNFWLILGLTVAVLVAKTIILYFSARAVGFPFRISLITGAGISNIGEFGFIIMLAAVPAGLLSAPQYQLIGSVAIYSMLLTPLLISAVAKYVLRVGAVPLAADQYSAESQNKPQIIIVGFGLAGQHLAQVLKSATISYSIIEAHGRIASRARANGEPVIFGDAARWETLERSGVRSAQSLILLLSEPAAIRICIGLARRINPNITVICRTRRMNEIESLLKAGADEVISEEFETSIELFTRVLNRFHVPRNIIRTQTKLLRADGYEMLREPTPIKGISDKLVHILAMGTTDIFQVMENHFAFGKSLQQIGLRSKTGATVVSVVRNERNITNPPPDLSMQSGDSLVIVGSHAQIEAAFSFLEDGNGT